MENLTVTLTDAAAEALKSLIAEQADSEGTVRLRFWVAGGGCSGLSYGMALDDNPLEEGDIELEDKGVSIVVDGMSARYVHGSEIDYTEDVLGGGFKVSNPNAVKSCGCSQSFTVEDDESGSTLTGKCGSCTSFSKPDAEN